MMNSEIRVYYLLISGEEEGGPTPPIPQQLISENDIDLVSENDILLVSDP